MAKSYDEYRLGEPYERPRRKGLKVVVILAALMAITILPAMAARGSGGKGHNTTGGSGGGGSYHVTVSPGAPYTFGQQVWVTTDAPIYPNNTGPWIWMKCYQDGTLVGTWDHAGFADGWYYQWPYDLGPTQSWTGGAADCTVTVVHTNNNKIITDASTSFQVGA